MSQNILLIDYEPRTVARVTEALAPLGGQLEVAKDLDAAVSSCAKSEPRVVLITSVLPRLKVEDAITQLRARAGLRHTPFLILMSGYTGLNPEQDARQFGAQGIVAKPFSTGELLQQVRALMQAPKAQVSAGPDTRNEVLEALRRSAGLQSGPGTVTSEDLFGDLIADEGEPVSAETQRISIPPPSPPAPQPPKPAEPAIGDTQRLPIKPVAVKPPEPARPPRTDTAVDRVVESSLSDLLAKPAAGPKERVAPTDTAVDRLLEQTLSGMDVSGLKGSAKPRPSPPPAAPQEPVAPPPPAAPPPVAPPPVKVAPPKPPAPPVREEKPLAPLPSGAPFGQYELIETIATGGMAEVYKARMQGVEGFQKIVAIKRILPHLTDNDEFVTMFIDEAKLAAQLQHPNIIHIYDLGKIERSYYIAMEYIDGKDLRSILRTLDEKKQRMPAGLALFIGSRLAAALDYAHRKRDLQGRAMSLVHRDVSPQNVLISYDGDIKLCDFGIAKAASKASHTRAGALKGKLQYMSPEQAWGKGIDHRSDIFSLGLVLYEMVTGTKPFSGDSELSILEQVRSPRLISPENLDPTLPTEVAEIIMKALREKREERFQTAAELASALDDLLQAIRPTPTAADLGGFLATLTGRERPVTAPVAVPPPIEAPKPAPPKIKPTPIRPEPVTPAEVVKPAEVIKPPRIEEVPIEPESGVSKAPRPFPVGLVAGLAAVVAVAVAGYLLLPQLRAGRGTAAAPTPGPETVELARQLAQQAVEERLGAPAPEQGAPGEVATASGTAAQAGPRPEVIATPRTAPAQPTAAAAARATVPPAAARVEPTAVTAAPPPVPATVEEPTPVPPTTEAPAPVPTRPPLVAEQPTVREGDLVEANSPGLTPPEPILSPRPAYPPLAARQRVGGTVIIQALVDENGAVQDVTVLRGVKPDLGLDAAAAGAVRRWRFRPATKDGVRVKSYYTAVIPFRP